LLEIGVDLRCRILTSVLPFNAMPDGELSTMPLPAPMDACPSCHSANDTAGSDHS
jgi:hypothetical protein